MFRVVIVFTLLIAAGCSGVQAQDEGSILRQKLLIGKWKLVRHTVDLEMQGPYQEETNIMPDGYIFTYQFLGNGTYTDEEVNDLPNIPNFKHTGKWKLSEGGNKLVLYDIHEIPAVEDTQLPKLELELLRLTETELHVPEFLFSDADKPGTSVYEKLPDSQK